METGGGAAPTRKERKQIKRLAEWDRLRKTGRRPTNPHASFPSSDEANVLARDRGRSELLALCMCALKEEASVGLKKVVAVMAGKEKAIVRVIGEFVLGLNSFQLRWILGRPLGCGGQSQVYEIRHRYRYRFLEPMRQKIQEAEEARQRMEEAPSTMERESAKKIMDRIRSEVEETLSTLPPQNFAVKMAVGVSSSKGMASPASSQSSNPDMLAQEARMMKLVTEAAADLTPGQPLPIPPLVEYCENRTLDASFLVMPVYPGGDLFDRLLALPKNAGERGVAEGDVVPVVRALTTEIARLHSFGVIHRDIKPENIVFQRVGRRKGPMLRSKWPSLTDGRDRLVLLDLGLAVSAGAGDDGQTQTDACGTVLYGAPEQVAGKPHGYTADIWSLGVVAYVLLCGQNPFQSGEGEAEQRALAARSEYQFPEGRPSAAAREFIRRCLLVDPRGRPTAVELLQANTWLRKGLSSSEGMLGTPGLGRHHVVSQAQAQAALSASWEESLSEVSHTPRKATSKDHFFGSPLSPRRGMVSSPRRLRPSV
uniref:Protein kinase domain-containing protein n=1 Tax=Pinguiococcus pyrenoidosus TaxID=172671 RepID=A0A7R9YAN5_9STRA